MRSSSLGAIQKNTGRWTGASHPTIARCARNCWSPGSMGSVWSPLLHPAASCCILLPSTGPSHCIESKHILDETQSQVPSTTADEAVASQLVLSWVKKKTVWTGGPEITAREKRRCHYDIATLLSAWLSWSRCVRSKWHEVWALFIAALVYVYMSVYLVILIITIL